MGFTGTSKDPIKQEILESVDMFDVLANLGFAMAEKSRSRWNNFYKGDTKLIVKTYPNGSALYFNSKDDQDKGTVFQLVENHSDLLKKDYYHVRKFLTGFLPGGALAGLNTNINSEKYRPIVTHFNPAEYVLRDHINSSLFEKRGLSGICESELFKGRVAWAAHNPKQGERNLFGGRENISFPLHRLDNETMVGLEYKYDSVKKQAPGSNKSEGFWLSNKIEGVVDLFITEAPLDSMSHCKMYKDRTGDYPALRYLATSGTVTDAQIAQILKYKEAQEQQGRRPRIFLGFDNDFSGYQFTMKVLCAASQDKFKVKISQEEINVDGTFFSLEPLTLRKNDPGLKETFSRFMETVAQRGLFPGFMSALAINKDFNEDLLLSMPHVYDFDNTIGSLKNLRNLGIEETIKKKQNTELSEKENSKTISLTKKHLEMANNSENYKLTGDEVDSMIKRYGLSVNDLNGKQIGDLRMGYKTFIRGLKSQKPDSQNKTYDAKVQFIVQGTGDNRTVRTKMDFKSDKLHVYPTIYGNEITADMRDRLRTEGYLYLPECSKTVKDPETAEERKENIGPVLLAVDTDLNTLAMTQMNRVSIYPKLKGQDLSEAQVAALKTGQPIDFTLGLKKVEARYNPVYGAITFNDAERKAKFKEALAQVPFATPQETKEHQEKLKQLAEQKKTQQAPAQPQKLEAEAPKERNILQKGIAKMFGL